MPKADKKNHILGDFFRGDEKKNAKTGKEFGKEGKKAFLRLNAISYNISRDTICVNACR